MIHLLFNLECTQPSGEVMRHGGGIYGEIVFRRIIERELPVSAYYDSRKWFNPEMKELIEKNGVTLFDVSQKRLEDIVSENDFNLIYTPMFGRTFSSFKGCKVIGTLHGLRDLEMPNDKIVIWYRPFLINWLKFHMRNLLSWKSRKRRYRFVEDIAKNNLLDFVVVSNHTACSFKANYPQFVYKKVPVFYSPSTIIERSFPKEIEENAKYFLIVSGDRWEKNALRAIMALDDLISNSLIPPNFKVLITGASSPNIYKYKIHNTNFFIFKGYVSDDELACLYHHAYCLIYPSLNEGFGYPPLEAMYHHVPVIASAICSIPEVCGDAILYFSPFSVNEIKCRIIQLLSNDLHRIMSEKGYRRFCMIREKQNNDLDRLIDYIYNNK